MKTCKTHRRNGCATCKARATTSDPYQDTSLWLTMYASGAYDTSSSCDTSYTSSYDSGSSSSDCGGGF